MVISVFQVEVHVQGNFVTPFQACGYEVLAVVFHENRRPQVRTRDQGGPPILGDMRHLYDLEHRLPGPRLGDKLGDGYQGFRRKRAYKTELVLGDNDTPDCIFKGGLEHSQLLSLVSASHGISRAGADLHYRVSSGHLGN